ncbi:MAG: hypothetical protein F9K32_20450 [Desulfobulbaceae bacterium]|nr:MAG: hypothetical protein F9K32_20450 [Desulfobulbaceae bacterium]
MMLPPHPNATESIAERVWRYGCCDDVLAEDFDGFTCHDDEFIGKILRFADGSAIWCGANGDREIIDPISLRRIQIGRP